MLLHSRQTYKTTFVVCVFTIPHVLRKDRLLGQKLAIGKKKGNRKRDREIAYEKSEIGQESCREGLAMKSCTTAVTTYSEK